MGYLSAFDEDWKRYELPFPKTKQEYRQIQKFDYALRCAQSDQKKILTENVHAAAKVALDMTTDAGIDHVVCRLRLVSKDDGAHQETAVFTIDSILRHAAKNRDEEIRSLYESRLEKHLRNVFKRAIQAVASRTALATKFFEILGKWKERGWFQEALPDVVKVVERAAPSAAKPDSGLLLRHECDRIKHAYWSTDDAWTAHDTWIYTTSYAGADDPKSLEDASNPGWASATYTRPQNLADDTKHYQSSWVNAKYACPTSVLLGSSHPSSSHPKHGGSAGFSASDTHSKHSSRNTHSSNTRDSWNPTVDTSNALYSINPWTSNSNDTRQPLGHEFDTRNTACHARDTPNHPIHAHTHFIDTPYTRSRSDPIDTCSAVNPCWRAWKNTFHSYEHTFHATVSRWVCAALHPYTESSLHSSACSTLHSSSATTDTSRCSHDAANPRCSYDAPDPGRCSPADTGRCIHDAADPSRRSPADTGRCIHDAADPGRCS
ncbi:unnamed protein product [Symbiodinium pilosum]|uniref:CID domain-containing protein n=1 Tax=Symbiodinium pilosum TaxID=2952 RepID=A0A812XLR6_SYMPI|nr:unnamed protein product [Symbiodinium pilosum]